MSILSRPLVASSVALAMQCGSAVGSALVSRRRGPLLPEYPGITEQITIPTSVAPARAAVYWPADRGEFPPVHVNFHGGGYVMRGAAFDDPLCRYLAAVAGVVVVNVDYAVAPQHRFPEPPHQAFEAVRWVAANGSSHSWDGSRLTVGGQSAGGGLAAAVARQALERGEPAIALQVLHYAPLDLVTPASRKPSPVARPVISPWMGEVFDTAYIPNPADRSDRLASPAHESDAADLTGIAPALVITCEYDRLRGDGERYARRLEAAGALVEHHQVAGADHAYDMRDPERARETYALIARRIVEAGRATAAAR